MSLGLIIFFIAIGIFLFIVEFMLIPGISVAGIGGSSLCIRRRNCSFIEFGSKTGLIVLAGTAISLAVVVTLMLRTGTWKKFMLTTTIDSTVDQVHKADGKVIPGDHGETITRLNPMGKFRSMVSFMKQRLSIF